MKSTASIKEIRTAHREMVRKLHPDAIGLQSADLSLALSAVSQAWSVLGDPATRREYDKSLAEQSATKRSNNSHGSASSKSGPVDDFVEQSDFEIPQIIVRAQFPWRFMLTLIGIGALLILALRSTVSTNIPQGPDSLIQSGSCVALDETQAVYEVSCDQPNDGVVRQLIGFDMTCPSDTFGYRDRQGMGIACLEP